MTDPTLGVGEAAARDTLGLSFDMLDVDRLRQWASNVDTYGPDLTHWAAPRFVSEWLQDLADRLETAVRDIGVLRAQGEAVEAARAHREPLEPSAGDLLIAAVDAWAEHGPKCETDPCGRCDALFNQVRLAHKVWQNSSHQSAALPPPQDPTDAQVTAAVRALPGGESASADRLLKALTTDPALPRVPEPDLMRQALLAFRRRAHFIGHPEEPMMDGFLKPRVPDWREVIKLVDEALRAARAGAEAPPPEEPK
jgi:hypothetical protein